jgi:hypothetical protein
MKLPIIALIGVAIVLQTGCVTGRRSLALPVPSHDIPPATQGKVYIAAVTDDREFQNKPSDPSIPSIDGDVTNLSVQEKDRMIGRQRNTFGHAMGDIGLAADDSVTKRVRLLVEQGLRRKGYEIGSYANGPYTVAVSVKEFWAWMTPGFIALTFEAEAIARDCCHWCRRCAHDHCQRLWAQSRPGSQGRQLARSIRSCVRRVYRQLWDAMGKPESGRERASF